MDFYCREITVLLDLVAVNKRNIMSNKHIPSKRERRVLSQDEIKEIFKQAIKEWMEEKYIAVGKWTVGAFLTAMVGGLTYFILWSNGWVKIH